MKHPVLFSVCFLFVLLLILEAVFPSEKKDGKTSYTYTTARAVRYDKYNKPPVNRTPPMSAETAERLSGTGYEGCRPNSFAEDVALKAAQLACRNCGYHTDNGRNSYCDYCRWMQQYGGGLPAEKRQGATSYPSGYYGSDWCYGYADPYDVADYDEPMDFYDDHYNDFDDYEDAEAYWEERADWAEGD